MEANSSVIGNYVRGLVTRLRSDLMKLITHLTDRVSNNEVSILGLASAAETFWWCEQDDRIGSDTYPMGRGGSSFSSAISQMNMYEFPSGGRFSRASVYVQGAEWTAGAIRFYVYSHSTSAATQIYDSGPLYKSDFTEYTNAVLNSSTVVAGWWWSEDIDITIGANHLISAYYVLGGEADGGGDVAGGAEATTFFLRGIRN